MYLKSIKANGFKSFADKTTISLDNGITCIVGPNGSGKSNIVDAIRWVLGEQSFKSLRGASNMSDIIFAGSKTRPLASRAEVTLTFDNTDHYLKSDLEEVEIKRVLYRSGESEYFINDASIRLKDITDLFLDTGVGIDSFNIITQGNIESIINSKPIERRVIFEEAAEILKYKKRKDESLKKLTKTQENIDKVNLIISEIETTLEPLRIQSTEAQKYLELKSELENIEIATITAEITEINETYKNLQMDIDKLNKEIIKSNTTNSKTTSDLETLKLKNIKLDDEISKQNSRLLEITEQFLKLQNEKELYKERQKMSGNSEEVSNSIVTLKSDILELDKSIQVLESEITSLNTQITKTTNELSNVNEEESILKIKYNSQNKEYNKNIQELFVLQNKKEALESVIESDAKIPSAVKNVLNNPRLKGVYNTIGKLLDVDDTYSTAISISLGASSNFVVVENESSAKECINFLKENKLGRATFFPLNIIKEKYIPKDILERLTKINGFIGIASDLVSYDPKFANIIKNQLGNIIVVKDLDTLNRLGRILEYKYRIVSLDGEILHTGGSITGGTINNNSNIIKDKVELEKTKNNIKLLENQNNSLQEEINKFLKDLDILKNQEEELNRKIITLNATLTEKTNILNTKLESEQELQKSLESAITIKTGSVDQKLLALMEEVTSLKTNKDILENTLTNLKNEKEELTIKIDTLDKEYHTKNTEYNKLQTALKNKEVELGKLDIRLDNLLLNLNETYNLTYEKAKLSYVLDIDKKIAINKVTNLKQEINNLGNVNVYAIEEYDRVKTRYDFLTNQKIDLENATTNLLSVIKEMDEIMITKFQTTFEKVKDEFSKVFQILFKGGTGLLKLTDPDNILETGIEIIAEPPGKKLNSIALLSGGEKTLTAIALLFAILNVKTVPFCILDEVEASLDEANVDTFGNYLQNCKKNSQFILITHKKRTMEYADSLYGITMQESGVSKIVSVKLESK